VTLVVVKWHDDDVVVMIMEYNKLALMMMTRMIISDSLLWFTNGIFSTLTWDPHDVIL